MIDEAIPASQVLKEELEDPSFRVEWERTALGREFAKVVLGYRIDHGLTQAALARRLGMQQSAVARLEIGESNPTVETMRRVVDLLGEPVDIRLWPANGASARVDGGVRISTPSDAGHGARAGLQETNRSIEEVGRALTSIVAGGSGSP